MAQLNEIHQVARDMVHLAVQRVEDSSEWVCLIEGGGVCLGNSFLEWADAESWIRSMFRRIFPDHRCDLGCIRLPGAEFCADAEVLERLAGEAMPRSPKP
jgi:hypothetical protein